MVIEDSKIKGYFKPVFEDARIFILKEKDRTLFQGIKELFTEGAQEVLENRSINTTASKIPIEGNLEDPSTDFWATFVAFFVTLIGRQSSDPSTTRLLRRKNNSTVRRVVN